MDEHDGRALGQPRRVSTGLRRGARIGVALFLLACREGVAADPSTAGHDAGAPAADGAPTGRFVDVTEQAGLSYVQAPPEARTSGSDGTHEQVVHLAPSFTGGAAAADYDADGDVDLYVTRLAAPGILFRNRGDGRFEDVTVSAGLEVPGHDTVGAAWGDVDNDGDPDLYVTTLGTTRHLLFVNGGDGVFVEDAVARGVALDDGRAHRGYGASFGDFDRDGWLDLHTTEWQYGLLDPPAPSRTRLFRNRGGDDPSLGGFFADVTLTTGTGVETDTHGALAFASSFPDLDDDGRPELVVASDFGSSRLFWNDGDGRFTDGTQSAGVGTDEAGMGSTIGDYDGDGLLDWFVTSIWCGDSGGSCGFTGNRLYRNLGGRRFADDTERAGVLDGGWGWGTTFFELDNDGDLDLVMTNGRRAGDRGAAPFVDDSTRLWSNDGTGGMVDVSSACELVDRADGKGLLVLDYDADGDEDVFIVNHAAGGRLWENRVANTLAHGWLRLRLEGVTANRSAFGARVRVERRAGSPVLVRELLGGNNYLGQNEPVVQVGLGPGDDPVHRIEVIWPTPGPRKVQVLRDVAPNQVLELREPE